MCILILLHHKSVATAIKKDLNFKQKLVGWVHHSASLSAAAITDELNPNQSTTQISLATYPWSKIPWLKIHKTGIQIDAGKILTGSSIEPLKNFMQRHHIESITLEGHAQSALENFFDKHLHGKQVDLASPRISTNPSSVTARLWQHSKNIFSYGFVLASAYDLCTSLYEQLNGLVFDSKGTYVGDNSELSNFIALSAISLILINKFTQEIYLQIKQDLIFRKYYNSPL